MSLKAKVSGGRVVGYLIVSLFGLLALSITGNIYLGVTNHSLVFWSS